MKISEVIRTLQAIQSAYGDLHVGGGYLHDDSPLQRIMVLDREGCEIWPASPTSRRKKPAVDGVFLSC